MLFRETVAIVLPESLSKEQPVLQEEAAQSGGGISVPEASEGWEDAMVAEASLSDVYYFADVSMVCVFHPPSLIHKLTNHLLSLI